VTFAQLISEKRPCLEQIIADLSRRHLLAPPETDEFRRVVQRALERHDYELLRAFDGRSTWETYLNTVLTREFFTFQAALWGDWRPSREAVRLGPVATLLEELVLRDHFSVADAIEWMRTSHRVDEPRHKIREFAAELGLVPSEQPARTTSLAGSAERGSDDDTRLREALRDALALVSPDDRLILELRFRDHQPLTRIARMLKIEVRPLQRRIDSIKEVIRESLMTQGIARHEVEDVLQSVDSDTSGARDKWWHFVISGSSTGL
jgi:DNA-directed RNA polymerase specialized sigma24 family protein